MPMSNEDGSVWITYNGEIDNTQKLRPELEGLGHNTFRLARGRPNLRLYRPHRRSG
jgi:asparagine synthetase B (glutamine-hydrolysing)